LVPPSLSQSELDTIQGRHHISTTPNPVTMLWKLCLGLLAGLIQTGK
jgi:hypothetical protein